ncbi:MAG: hypothetical protein ABOK23_08725 [Candidatus Methanoperedens sp.]|nr:hypothetical protein [Candidatus Methanoperedens sp.]MCZ7396447.1 hypothetical protein [Candidatus Methanoperedens sp.]
MDSRTTMLFKRIQSDGISLKDIIKKIKENEYSKSKGEGFAIKEIGENIIYANYIFQYPSFINKFDDESLDIKKEKIINKAVISFSIDFSHNLIVVFSNSSNARRLLTELGKITDFEMPIEDVNFSPLNLLPKFKKSNNILNITSLRIRNFKFNQKLSGTFWVRILEQQTAKELIDNYSGEIIYMGASTKFDGRNVSMGFYENGSLMIFDKLNNLYDIIDEIKNILFLESN